MAATGGGGAGGGGGAAAPLHVEKLSSPFQRFAAKEEAPLPPSEGPRIDGIAFAKELPERIDLPREEERTLQHWEAVQAFKKQLKLSEGKPPFTFYDGPPFATGLPHYGHILAGTIKDTVTRYATQTGHYVTRRFGWDCHGLPVEFEIDKMENITSRDQVLAMGIDKYNAKCRGIVTRHCSEWEEIVTRLGRWIDFKDDYKTMDPWYMESVWWVFKQLWEKGLVYRGYKVMPYSTACTTPLSNFEAGLNYKEDTKDPAVVVTFPLVSEPDVALLAWTTTPWTLPSNLALCVNPTLEYVRIRDTKTGHVYILGASRISQLYPKFGKKDYKGGEFEELARFPGATLVGLRYVPLFDYFREAMGDRAFRVVADAYVTDDAGTGVVHQAPAFGEDDYRVCVHNEIVSKDGDVPCPIDANGRFVAPVTDFEGVYVKEADEAICRHLKDRHRLVQKGTIVHSYPFCWRSDTPLIYRAIPSWFVRVEDIKEKLLKNNESTYWVPTFVKEKRFHNWLADARDWAISRNRYWGTPLPIWASDDMKETIVIGSIEELQALTGTEVRDLHRESIDGLTIPSRTGRGVLRRVDEVFDCWFESGSMPYAQVHFPFEGEPDKHLAECFPADFIAEGLDQTRGWFYTLMVLSTALFDRPAFKNLIVNGLVLAEDGKKMSKRLKNYPDPVLVVNEHSADALRLYLINSPVVRAEPLRFSEKGVMGVVKDVLLPWYSSFRYLAISIAQWVDETGSEFVPDPAAAHASTNDMDHWITAASQSLIRAVREEMAAYRLYNVVPRLVYFIGDLTNWYIKLNRPRLSGRAGHDEARVALSVLYDVHAALCRLMSPFAPFLSEFIYQRLRAIHPDRKRAAEVGESAFGAADSVHFLSIPEYDAALLDPAIEERVKALQAVVEAVRTTRDRRNLSLKYPVRSILVVHRDPEVLARVRSLETYVLAEANALRVDYSTDEKAHCTVTAIADGGVLGARLGAAFRPVQLAVEALSHEAILSLLESGSAEIAGQVIEKEAIRVSREFSGDKTRFEAEVAPDGGPVVVVDAVIDEELRAMGLARELCNRVQKTRKKADLFPTDVVTICVTPRLYTPDERRFAKLKTAFAVNREAEAAGVAAAAGGAGAGAGGGGGGGGGGAGEKGEKGSKGGKGGGEKGGKGGGEKGEKGGKGGKGGGEKGEKGEKGADKGAKKLSPEEQEAQEIAAAEQEVVAMRNAMALHRELMETALRLRVVPECEATVPPHAGIIEREVYDMENGTVVDVVITRPAVHVGDLSHFVEAAVAAGAENPARFATHLRNFLGLRDPTSLPQAGGAEITVVVDGKAATLAAGRHFFADPISQLRGSADAAKAWRDAGFGALVDAYLA